MEGKSTIRRIQMTCTEEEYSVVKTVSAMGKFAYMSDYIRSLVTADIVAKKKAARHPEIYGMSTHEWDNLTEGERERYMGQIAPVRPSSIGYFVRSLPGPGQLHGNDELGI